MKSIIIASLLALAATQANAGSWLKDEKPCGSKCPAVKFETLAPSPFMHQDLGGGPTYYSGNDARRQELERRSDEAWQNYREAHRDYERIKQNQRMRHQDACQRAYNRGVPYETLDRYC